MEDNLIKPKSAKDIKAGDIVTTVGGKYANLTVEVVKVGGSYVTFLHPVTKETKRTWWSFCYVHPVKDETIQRETMTPSDVQVDVLLEMLTEKLQNCSIQKHTECLKIIQDGLNKRKNSVSAKPSK